MKHSDPRPLKTNFVCIDFCSRPRNFSIYISISSLYISRCENFDRFIQKFTTEDKSRYCTQKTTYDDKRRLRPTYLRPLPFPLADDDACDPARKEVGAGFGIETVSKGD